MRGSTNPAGARATIARGLLGSTQQLPGSQSFNWSTPLVKLPGRAGLDLNLVLYYNSRVWDLNPDNGNITFNADRDFPSYGFRLDYGYLENDVADGFWILTDADGSKHRLNLKTANIWDSVDSTYLELNSTTMVLSYSDGWQVSYQVFPTLPSGSNPLYRPIQINDTNGNYMSITYVPGRNQAISTITDAVGRVVNFNYDGSGHLTSITQGTAPNMFTYASFQWGSVALKYNFPSLIVADTQQTGTSIDVMTRCTLPNGTYYTFSYGDWGIVNRIDNFSNSDAPRGYESYNYPTAATALSDVPTYTQQIVSPDGTAQYKWNYATTKSGDIVSAQSITDPSNTVTTFNLRAADPCSGTTTSVVTSGSTTLRTTNNTWTPDGAGNNCLLTSATALLNDSGQQFTNSYTYDANGNLTDEIDKDYSGTTLRETVIAYFAPTSNHILSLASRVQVKDGSGTVKGQTDFLYDSTTLTTVNGAVQNGGTSAPQGNLTSITRYSNAQQGTGAVTRTFNYDSLGNIIKAQLDSCRHKSWTYSSLTQYAYPDSVSLASDCSSLQLTDSTTYDLSAGLRLSSTDPNSQVTNFHYDSFRRPDYVTLPNGTILYTDYDDAAASPAVTSRNNINTLQRSNIADGLGRIFRQQAKNGSTTVVSTVDTAYDGLSHITSISNPYAPSDTLSYTNITYDALGRATQVSPPSGGSYQYSYNGNTTTISDPAGKQVRRLYDAIGRLSEVDEPGFGSLPGKATITINGAEQSTTTTQRYCAQYSINGRCVDWEFDTTTDYDSGTVSVTVNGRTKSVTYGQNDTGNTITSNLAAAFNADVNSQVTATASSNVLSLTATTTGANTNYSLSVGATFDSTLFATPSFTPSAPANLSGGTDPAITMLTPAVTTYAYRPTGELSTVTSGAQTRTYIYDDLGRLTSSTIPESGTTQFTFFDFGDVKSRTDARGVITNYAYDGLNRLQQVSYDVGTTGIVDPGATSFAYGTDATSFNNGRLVTMTDSTGSEAYTYQAMGWPQQLVKTISGTSYTIGYGYDALGDLTQIVYPSSRIIGQNVDVLGRLQSITNNTANVLSVNSYGAAGQITGVTYGNNVTGAFGYNDHLQFSSMVYTSGPTTLLSLNYDYGAQNNGQIHTITDSRGDAYSTTYTYDPLNRLATAQTVNLTAANTWALAWDYDRYGNRLDQRLTGGTMSVGQPQLNVDSGTNRISTSGFSYDANGNLTNDGVHLYSFDAANHIAKVDNGATATYTYDGNGFRIMKGTTVYVRSGTQVIAEYSSGLLQNEYVYSGGELLATISGTTTTYHHSDHLSDRLETDATGVVQRTFGHLPFGETWYETGIPDKWKFTVYERDAETGLDCALARYDSSNLGRFMSVDPLAGDISNPQSLNRYAYSLNNPVNLTDPLGLAACVLNIKVNNNANLSDADIAKIEARINEVFGATSSPSGDTVSASFSSTSGDFNLNVNSGNPGYTGIEFHALGVSVYDPTVFVGAGQSSYGSDSLIGLGTTAAHELTHRIAGGLNSYRDQSLAGGPNLMNADAAIDKGQSTAKDDVASPPTGFSKLTPQQVAKLFKRCKKKQKKQKEGGGGGGNNDTLLPRPGPPSGDGGFGGDEDCPNGDCGSHPPCYPNCGGPPPTLKHRSALEPENIDVTPRRTYESVAALRCKNPSLVGNYRVSNRQRDFDSEPGLKLSTACNNLTREGFASV